MTDIKRHFHGLREKTKQSQLLNSTFTSLAMRKRPRARITTHGIYQSMSKQGFKFRKDEYSEVFKIMAENGFGTLEAGPKGKIYALRDIQYTLASIGRVAVGQDDELMGFRGRSTWRRRSTVKRPLQHVMEGVDRVENRPVTNGVTNVPVLQGIVFRLKIGTHSVELGADAKLPASDLVSLLIKLRT